MTKHYVLVEVTDTDPGAKEDDQWDRLIRQDLSDAWRSVRGAVLFRTASVTSMVETTELTQAAVDKLA